MGQNTQASAIIVIFSMTVPRINNHFDFCSIGMKSHISVSSVASGIIWMRQTIESSGLNCFYLVMQMSFHPAALLMREKSQNHRNIKFEKDH